MDLIEVGFGYRKSIKNYISAMELKKLEQIPEILVKILAKVERIEMMLEILLRDTSVAQEEELLTVSEAGQLLNLAVSTMYSKVSRNEIPVCKRGNRLYFNKADVLGWVRSGRMKTVEEISREVGEGRSI